jgi:hypothetical protein
MSLLSVVDGVIVVKVLPPAPPSVKPKIFGAAAVSAAAGCRRERGSTAAKFAAAVDARDSSTAARGCRGCTEEFYLAGASPAAAVAKGADQTRGSCSIRSFFVEFFSQSPDLSIFQVIAQYPSS